MITVYREGGIKDYYSKNCWRGLSRVEFILKPISGYGKANPPSVFFLLKSCILEGGAMKAPAAPGIGRIQTKDKNTVQTKRPLSGVQLTFVHRSINTLAWSMPRLAKVGLIRHTLANRLEKRMRAEAANHVETKVRPARAVQDRLDVGISILRTIERALARGRLSSTSFRKVLSNLASNAFINKGEPGAKEKFKEEFGVFPPEVLLISPTKYCNLRCKGCYADSAADSEKLEWDVFDRMVQEAHDLWGARFFVFSGGEPLIYRDKGHGVLDIVEKYADSYFMMYTNATLIDDKLARRLGELGNVMPAVSVEGMKDRTDHRRGAGVFDKIIAAMERLLREKVLFGISMTATKENVEEVFSDEVIDFYFNEMGALFGWVFHYMPIGRAITLDLLPTPEQRLWMWKRAWELIRERHIFLVDFWNGGTISQGCIGAGRQGGYMTIDWNGYANACVFMPYSPVNMNDAYAKGMTLKDVWAHPFFERLREWQRNYGYNAPFSRNPELGNWMMPCPIRDHYAEFYELYTEFMPKPNDENAADAVMDKDYREGMKEYNKAVAELLDPIWKKDYLGKTH